MDLTRPRIRALNNDRKSRMLTPLGSPWDQLQAVTSIKKVADQTRAVVRRGTEAANTATKRVRDTSMHASDSLVAFTKENPIKTILVAAASAALLLALFNALARSRDASVDA
jgi:ElaB/YqjD/DUF883 family membrane-anchored ribosome-binding protein